MIFSWAEDSNGKLVHVDSVKQGLSCNCFCPCCHERLQARHGKIRNHGFAHHSMERGANLEICYNVCLYKLAEHIIQQEKKIHVPSYYEIFKDRDIVFSEVIVDDWYNREDKQPDVIGITPQGERYLIEFTFAYKVQHKKKIDYKNLNCIEIDLSSQTLETLQDFIIHSSEDKEWLNNQLCFEQIEKLYSKNNKLVKVTNENECIKCKLHYNNNNCCGIRSKNHQSIIRIYNNGETYRVCKVEEFNKKKMHFDECNQPKSNWNYYEKQRQSFFGKSVLCKTENVPETNIRDEETINKYTNQYISDQDILELTNRYREQNALESTETAKIESDQRSCFICRNNLEWMCRIDDRYAHCGPYKTMGVPQKTPPDTAKTCNGFRLKLNH